MTTNREVFNKIAESWYRVRHWPLLKEELEEVATRWRSGKLLNVGCAHGPDFLPFNQDFKLWGVDSSQAMLKQALGYSAKFMATYHHIKGREEREKAFVELRRVLKPQGEAFLTVWNHGQPGFCFKSKEQQVPWRLKEKTIYRYYHLFSYGELRKLLIKTGWEIITMLPEKSYHFPIKNFSRNICVLVRKP